ncbi:hypothetical protein F4801DRAFT_585329 [Xylaria longipes]|nr:hypothetical protein F4801DRAFT_585329 [Xylaria longipes]
MTKPWDAHEATIKELYAEKTLSQVRKIMIEKYNFKASTRAYRGRLDKWGVRKYNCRRRSDGGSTSAGSPEGSVSGSDITASPTLSQHSVERSRDPASYPAGQQTRDSDHGMPHVLGRSYSTMEMDAHRTDTEHRNRTLVPPTQEIQYGWNLQPAQPASPPTIFGPPDMASTSGHLYGYQPLSPTSSTYPSHYESDQTARDRRENYPQMPTRQYSTIPSGSTYPPVRGYGHGHSIAGIRSFDTTREHNHEHSGETRRE